MSVPQLGKTSSLESTPAQSLGILAVATIVCLIPFVNKAFCIDDPLFLWAAQQIQKNPLDFYGCDVNWYGVEMPLSEVTKNPPIACFYLALAAACGGWSEPVLHAAFLLPAIASIWGTWYLGRSMCGAPRTAALVTLASPVFLVSSTNVMCDTMTVCGWVWGIALWKLGLDSGKKRWLAISSLLIAVTALTKYFGVSLIPLLLAYTVARHFQTTQRSLWEPIPQIAWFAIPILILAGYQWWTWRVYGRGLLLDAADYASVQKWSKDVNWGVTTLIACSFTGGSFLPVILYAPWMWSKRGLALQTGIAAAVTLTLYALFMATERGYLAGPPRLAMLFGNASFDWGLAVQLALFSLCGGLVLWLAVDDCWRTREPDALLLALWVFGTFAFAGFINWSCNGRSVLPIAPALGILLVRRLEHFAQREKRIQLIPSWVLVPAAVVGLTVTWADYCQANAARTAASQIAKQLAQTPLVWFEGHWGFQYYMQQHGAHPLDFKHLKFEAAEVLVLPGNNTNVRYFPPPHLLEELRPLKVTACGWLATMQSRVGAGFYSDVWGPLPFACGTVPDESYRILLFKNGLPRREEAKQDAKVEKAP